MQLINATARHPHCANSPHYRNSKYRCGEAHHRLSIIVALLSPFIVSTTKRGIRRKARQLASELQAAYNSP